MAIDKEFMPECPFFRTQRKKYIECEGLCDHSVIRCHFAREKGMINHMTQYCCSMNFGKCPMGKMLYAKYEE